MAKFETYIDHFNGFLSYRIKRRLIYCINLFITANQLCDENVMKFWYGFEKGCQKSSFFLAFAHSDSRQYLEYFIFRKCYFFVLKFRSNLICVFLFWCITHCFLLSQLEQIHTFEWISKGKTCFVKSTQTGWNPNVHSDWKLEHTSNICFQWVKTLVLEIRCIPSLWYIFQYVSKIHL